MPDTPVPNPAHTPASGDANEVIDIETYAKEGRTPPPGKHYRIRVDKLHLDIESPAITGREILRRAGKQPVERYRLDQKLTGGRTQKVELDQTVDLTTPGIERFMTLPLDQTEGAGSYRRGTSHLAEVPQ